MAAHRLALGARRARSGGVLSRRLPWIVTGLAALVGIGSCVGWIVWYERNTARAQSEFVARFAETEDATLYCGNGYGLGIVSANDHPWWEWTLVTNRDPGALADAFSAELARQGFEIDIGRNQIDSRVMAGRNAAGLTVRVEIGPDAVPDNCNPDFAEVVTDVDPDSFETVVVVLIRDEARGR